MVLIPPEFGAISAGAETTINFRGKTRSEGKDYYTEDTPEILSNAIVPDGSDPRNLDAKIVGRRKSTSYIGWALPGQPVFEVRQRQ